MHHRYRHHDASNRTRYFFHDPRLLSRASTSCHERKKRGKKKATNVGQKLSPFPCIRYGLTKRIGRVKTLRRDDGKRSRPVLQTEVCQVIDGRPIVSGGAPAPAIIHVLCLSLSRHVFAFLVPSYGRHAPGVLKIGNSGD